jgi:hypothetical protein
MTIRIMMATAAKFRERPSLPVATTLRTASERPTHLGHVTGFPDRGILRVLRPTPAAAADDEPFHCRNGVVLQAAVEERTRPPALAHPCRAPPRDRHLDRDHLASPPKPNTLGNLIPIEFEIIAQAADAA